MNDSHFPRTNPGHDWLPDHRLGPPRRGPIVSARALDVSELRPEGATLVRPTASPAGPSRLATLRDELRRRGWTVSEGTTEPELLAERDLRLDLTALRNVHLLQLACGVEFGIAILLGFVWPALGHPVWQGEAITATAIVGAVGIVAILARVEFVSLVLVVERVPGHPAKPEEAGSTRPGRLVWASRVWSRNWEVLGDRGGRAVLRLRRTGESDEAAAEAIAWLGGPAPERKLGKDPPISSGDAGNATA